MSVNFNTTDPQVSHIEGRSTQLHDQIMAALQAPRADASPNHELAYRMCLVVIEQAAGLRLLAATGLVTAAASLMRVQFETLLRAVWMMSAADLDAPDQLAALLRPGGESDASGLPGVDEMLEQIRAKGCAPTPVALIETLDEIRMVSWHTVHSFVHGGISERLMYAQLAHAELAPTLMQHANSALATAARTMAFLRQSDEGARKIGELSTAFADCLPATTH